MSEEIKFILFLVLSILLILIPTQYIVETKKIKEFIPSVLFGVTALFVSILIYKEVYNLVMWNTIQVWSTSILLILLYYIYLEVVK